MGDTNNKSAIGCLALIVILIIAGLIITFSSRDSGIVNKTDYTTVVDSIYRKIQLRSKNIDNELKLKKVIESVSELPEISWIIVESNSIYIGFNTIPEDLEFMCNIIALNGNRAINFGTHVYAIDANKYNNEDAMYYILTVTYRHGKKE